MALPHLLKRIRLELARSKDFPMGSARHGYEFVAPLDSKAHIDPQMWEKYREHCGVRRFWNGADDEIGWLVYKPGGREHGSWMSYYEMKQVVADEPGYRFGVHAFRLADYVSIRDEEGEMHTFVIASVEPAT